MGFNVSEGGLEPLDLGNFPESGKFPWEQHTAWGPGVRVSGEKHISSYRVLDMRHGLLGRL